MQFEIKKIRKFIRKIQKKNIIDNNNSEKVKFLSRNEKASYNKKIFSKKIEQKRKRKIYKSQFEKSIFFESQNQFDFFFKFKSFFKLFQTSLKTINVKQQNVQINQILIAKLIIRLRIIRYLYEKHSNVEFCYKLNHIID